MKVGDTLVSPLLPPPYFLAVCIITQNAIMDFVQTWHTHVFGSEEEPYFKVTINIK